MSAQKLRTASHRLWEAIKSFEFLSVLGAVVLIIACLLGYNALFPEGATRDDWSTLVKGMIGNLLPVFILFLGSFFIFGRMQNLRQQEFLDELGERVRLTIQSPIIERFNEVPWASLIINARNIDISVHYFDTWINQNSDAIQDFFKKRDVKLRIILPDSTSQPLLDTLLPRFPELNTENLRHKILNTSNKLRNIHKEAKATKAAVKIFQTQKLQWYCAVRFDKSVAVLSVYENARIGGTRAPAVLVDLTKHAKVAEWLENEFNTILETAREEGSSQETSALPHGAPSTDALTPVRLQDSGRQGEPGPSAIASPAQPSQSQVEQ